MTATDHDGGVTAAAAADHDVLESGDAGHRFLRGVSIRSLSYMFGLLLGATATPFVTRHLGSVNWGRYVTVTSLLFIAVALTEGGLSNLGIREFSTEGRTERREYMRSLIGLRLVLSCVGAAGALGFALLAGYRTVMVEGTAIACTGLFLTNLQATLAVVLTARLRLGWLAVTDFLAQAITAFVMLALVIDGQSLLPFYAATSVAAVVTLAVTVTLVRNDVTLTPAFDPRRWRNLVSESVVYAAATALGVVYFQVVVIAVNLLTTPVQSGYFGLGFRVLSIVNGLPWLLVTGAFPILARAAQGDAARLRYALQRLFETGLIVGGTMGLGLVLGAPVIVTIVGGSQYAGSVTALRILGAGIPATFLVATWAFALLSLSRYRQLIVVNGLAVLTAVGLCLALIPAHGAEGAAIVTASLEVALACGYGVTLVRSRPELRPALTLVPRTVLTFAVAIAVGVLLPVSSLVATVSALVVELVLLKVLGLIPAEVIAALTRRTSS